MILGICVAYLGGKMSDDVHFTRVSTDTRTIEKGDLFIALSGPHFDANTFAQDAEKKGACAVVVSRPVDVKIPTVITDDTLQWYQGLAHFALKRNHQRVIGITGSNGKTTTKDMVAAVLGARYRVHKTKANHNNEIGLPRSILAADEQDEIIVLEMGIERPDEMSELTKIAAPEISVITSIGDAHLENFSSKSAIACEKIRIVVPGVTKKLFVNGDNEILKETLLKKSIPATSVHASDAHLETIAPLSFKYQGVSFSIGVAGRHHLTNALLAIEVGRAFGVSLEEASRALQNAELTPMRGSILHGYHTILDCSYKSNPASVRASIDTLCAMTGPHIAVLGDMLGLGEQTHALHAEVGRFLPSEVTLFTFGDEAIAFADEFSGTHRHFGKDIDALIEALQNMPPATILVQASRALQAERIVKALVDPPSRKK